MISVLLQNKYLFLQMLKREIEARYRGSQLGFLWAFIYPILMLLVYTFVFGMVMRVKWGVEGQDNLSFGLILFAGLLLHGFLAEVLVGAVNTISSNAQYVKKVVFPLPLLNLVSVSNGLFHLCLGTLILLAMVLLSGGELHWTILLTPIVILPFIVFLIGVSYFVSVLGVYVRDLSQFIGVLVTVALFLGPIVYPFELVPDAIQFYVLWFNPLTIIVEQFRAVVLFGTQPNWLLLGQYSVFALVMLVVGVWFFKKTKDGFADVI